MLPDYPKIKAKIANIYDMRMKNIVDNSLLSGITHYRLFEGNRNKIIRNDGTVDDNEFTQSSSEIKIDMRDYEKLTEEEIVKKIDDCALEMARQQAQHFFKSISQLVESVGNAVSCDGEPLSPEHIFTALERLLISFNKDGTPNLPTFISGAQIAENFKEVQKLINETPELKKRMDALLETKRREWNDRESSRKLVG